MDINFPVSGVETSLWIPPLVAFVISFFTSMAGISGAFLLLPFQMSALKFTSPAVSPTNMVYNIFAIPSGVYRYLREGRMLWPLTAIVVAGTAPGVIVGGFVRLSYLPDPKPFKVFVSAVLLYSWHQDVNRFPEKKAGRSPPGKSRNTEGTMEGKDA